MLRILSFSRRHLFCSFSWAFELLHMNFWTFIFVSFLSHSELTWFTFSLLFLFRHMCPIIPSYCIRNQADTAIHNPSSDTFDLLDQSPPHASACLSTCHECSRSLSPWINWSILTWSIRPYMSRPVGFQARATYLPLTVAALRVRVHQPSPGVRRGCDISILDNKYTKLLWINPLFTVNSPWQLAVLHMD